MNIIKCVTCKKEKSDTEFGWFHGRKNIQCKKCREYHNLRWANNTNEEREKRRKYQRESKITFRARNFKNAILKKYGLSVEDYNKMLQEQKNLCAICGTEFSLERSKDNLNKLPCVDHNHQTNKVRGLLCRMCNISLGHLETGLMAKAIEYLRVYEK